MSSLPRLVGALRAGRQAHTEVGSVASGVTVAYQWLVTRKGRPATAIPGATSSSYKPRGSMRRARISVAVTYAQAGSTPTVVTTAAKRVR